MRIISGYLSSRVIKDKIPSGIRPTKDSVKESVFNILNNLLDFNGISVADVCAGTGSLGFEAISRGAGKCHFVDIQKNAIDYIKNVSAKFDINESIIELRKDDAISYLKNCNEKFDLIFFDPPYKSELYAKLSKLLETKNILNDKGIIVIEMTAFGYFKIPTSIKVLKEKINGDTKIIIAVADYK
jgi:16S rRNA (guanine966-N2)-methyltransferase